MAPSASIFPVGQVFVAANSNAVLRLVNLQNGMVLQKLKVRDNDGDNDGDDGWCLMMVNDGFHDGLMMVNHG